MTTNSQTSMTEPKKQKEKLSKQVEQEQKQRNVDHMDCFQWGWGGEEWRGMAQGIRSIIGRHKIDGESLRIVQENGEAKDLICTTHGHELRVGDAGGLGDAGQKGDTGEKKIEKTNSTINKIYFIKVKEN